MRPLRFTPDLSSLRSGGPLCYAGVAVPALAAWLGFGRRTGPPLAAPPAWNPRAPEELEDFNMPADVAGRPCVFDVYQRIVPLGWTTRRRRRKR